jgi:Leucine-rich repeat (LRR) protein
LDLSNNLLNEIPDCLGNLTGLRKLKLEGNHIPFERVWKLQCALPDCQIGFGAMVE